MDTDITGLLKRREIRFRNLDPRANDAKEAVKLLLEVRGIEHIMAITHDCLHIHYDLRHITLHMIESALVEVGFHLDNSLLCKMKRALFHYIEETQLMNLGHNHDQANSTLDVFINCYTQRQHGCRDQRPNHLRQYS
jgi:hypothetical protein